MFTLLHMLASGNMVLLLLLLGQSQQNDSAWQTHRHEQHCITFPWNDLQHIVQDLNLWAMVN